MATINISDLSPTSSELFSDSESYMNELGDSELDATYGGVVCLRPVITRTNIVASPGVTTTTNPLLNCISL